MGSKGFPAAAGAMPGLELMPAVFFQDTEESGQKGKAIFRKVFQKAEEAAKRIFAIYGPVQEGIPALLFRPADKVVRGDPVEVRQEQQCIIIRCINTVFVVGHGAWGAVQEPGKFFLGDTPPGTELPQVFRKFVVHSDVLLCKAEIWLRK